MRTASARRRTILVSGCAASAMLLAAVPSLASASPARGLDAVRHIVVIYDENHSFDNLYGSWEGVDGLSSASAAQKTQLAQDGTPLASLPQNDVNLAAYATANGPFANAPFDLATPLPADATTCPIPNGPFKANGWLKGTGLPGGCTEDLVHRYYQEQYQINGGQQNRYTQGSDALGLTQGYYRTQDLPIYKYLHSDDAPKYAIADHFFQSAFGGSFLNHQWLIAAATPTFPGAPSDLTLNPTTGKLYSPSGTDLHSVVDSNGEPTNYPLYHSTGLVADGALTQAADSNGNCVVPAGAVAPKPGTVCGDYAVNTIQPMSHPYAPNTAVSRRLPLQTAPTIGDRLSAKGVDWAWYSGGWDNAAGNVNGPGWTMGDGAPMTCDNHLHSDTGANEANPADTYPYCASDDFQYHHQAFNYFANYAEGAPGRSHLQDESAFISAARAGTLKPVSFVKPEGRENEHPGYASEHLGSDHLVDLIKAIEDGPDGKDTLIVVTYDEFGGQWDHVAPPAAGAQNAVADQWGPGTRIPALIVSRLLRGGFQVDSTSHDTTSIMATIEHRFGLAPVATRDAQVADLSGLLNGVTRGGR